MIRSFRGPATERPWTRHRARGFHPRIERVASRKLVMLDAAESLDDLRVPPGNRLEALKGDRAGQHSITDQPAVAGLFRVDARGP